MLSTDISDAAWGKFWWWFCVVILLMTVVITAWVSVGGIKNLRELYEMRGNIKRDEHDDGTMWDIAIWQICIWKIRQKSKKRHDLHRL